MLFVSKTTLFCFITCYLVSHVFVCLMRKRITDATTKTSRLRATASNKHAQLMEPVRTEVAQAILSRLAKKKEDGKRKKEEIEKR